MAQCSLRRNG